MSGKKSEMKGWKDEVRDLRGIFPGDAKTRDVALHPVVLERQTEGIWPESGGGRERRECIEGRVRPFGEQVGYLQRGEEGGLSQVQNPVLILTSWEKLLLPLRFCFIICRRVTMMTDLKGLL